MTHRIAPLLILFALVLAVAPAFADVVYVYDNLNRLVRVIDETGRAATYHYDPVGNLLRITRETGVPQNTVATASQSSGARGTTITLTFSGFNLAGAVLLSSCDLTLSNVPSTAVDEIIVDVTIGPTAPLGECLIELDAGLGRVTVPFTVTDPPPTVTITEPAEGTTVVEGSSLTLTAEATDNVRVDQVVWRANGVAEPPLSSPPYSRVITVPIDVTSLTIEAIATDDLGQTSIATRTVAVTPDPPPTITITEPAEGTSVVEGSRLTLRAQATDNVLVAGVVWQVNSEAGPPLSSPPYTQLVTVPIGATSLSIEATAIDNLGRTATVTRSVAVQPDLNTTVVGLVTDLSGQPVAGATVTVFREFSATTGTGGTFTISGVPTALGPVTAVARAVLNGQPVIGSSSSTPPVNGGTTDVGTIVFQSETDIGSPLALTDDSFAQVPLPFAFPFFGTSYNEVFVGSNGYLTFTAGDRTFTESEASFIGPLPRIAVFFRDLDPGVDLQDLADVYVNDQLSGRVVITWLQVPEFEGGGANTFQAILFADGRIRFVYQAMTALDGLVGLTPGGSTPDPTVVGSTATPVVVDYTATPQLTFDQATGLYELFSSTSNLFDLGNGGGILWTPIATGGYQVDTLEPPTTTVVGQVVDTAGQPVSDASVSVFPRFRTSTDAAGAFLLERVPAALGDLVVTVRHLTTDGRILHGESSPTPPVVGGITDVGTITVVAKTPLFETDPGTPLALSDDSFASVTLPFEFPFFGTTYTEVFVGSNGYLTFTGGDTRFNESVTTFIGPLPRIAAFFDDLNPRVGGAVSVSSFPDRVAVSYRQVPEFGTTNQNTLQVILFADGRIQMGYGEMSATDGLIGITPGGPPPAPLPPAVDFSATPAFSTSDATAIYEQFFTAFDLDFSFIVFTPNPSGGYDVLVH